MRNRDVGVPGQRPADWTNSPGVAAPVGEDAYRGGLGVLGRNVEPGAVPLLGGPTAVDRGAPVGDEIVHGVDLVVRSGRSAGLRASVESPSTTRPSNLGARGDNKGV